MILYLDRAAISSAKTSLATALSLSDAAMGAVFSAFALGYAFAQIPSGWLADCFRPRVTLAFVVALWSLFTVLTGVASGLATLLVVRFLFGAAEAGAFPGSARVIYNWLPPRMHGIANGILFSGALLGGAVAFPFFQWLLGAHGWRIAFFLLGVPGGRKVMRAMPRRLSSGAPARAATLIPKSVARMNSVGGVGIFKPIENT